jgi:predicted membrane protein
MIPESRVKRDRAPLVVGVVFILIGTFLLLEKLGLVPHGFTLHLWPTIFIVIGLVKVAYADGRLAGIGLIGVGVLLQLSEMHVIRVRFWDLWPVLIIIAGAAMLWYALTGEKPALSAIPQFDACYIFGGGERQVNTQNFQGARLMAVFGGYKVDMRHADIDGAQAVIEANAVFGGGEILVPENWLVVVEGAGVFGAYEDKTRHIQTDAAQPAKTLVIRGAAVFGGIEVKN